MKFQDLTNQKFGRLLVLKKYETNDRHTMWTCQCDCGKIINVYASHLKSGASVSCGCLSKERISKLNLSHGNTNTRLYHIWGGIKTRCYNKQSSSYRLYGDKGVIVCNEWLGKNGFINFYNWSMSNGYSDDLTIDRIDNNGNYEPSNCRWADKKTQSNNTRRTVFLEYNGEKYSMKELCEHLCIDYKRFFRAYKYYKFDLEKSIKYSKNNKEK